MPNEDAQPDSQSRAMFVARLENMQNNGDTWLTIAAVLALLNDCDMLASRQFAAAPADAAPSVAPEPVAWQMIDKHGNAVYVPVTYEIKPDLVLDCDLRYPDNAPHEQHPLFTHPPRAPLTEEQKRDLVKECDLDWQRGFMPLFDGDPTNRYAVLIEAVEAAHGIGGK